MRWVKNTILTRSAVSSCACTTCLIVFCVRSIVANSRSTRSSLTLRFRLRSWRTAKSKIIHQVLVFWTLVLLTLFIHAAFEALIISTRLTTIARQAIYDTRWVFVTGILLANVLLHRTSKEALTAFARDDAVVIAGSAIAAHHARCITAHRLLCFIIKEFKPRNCRWNMRSVACWRFYRSALSLALKNCAKNWTFYTMISVNKHLQRIWRSCQLLQCEWR